MNNISLAQEIPGWFDETDMVWYRSIIRSMENVDFIEIGSYAGRSITSILDIAHNNNVEVFCVDTWKGSEEHQQNQPCEIIQIKEANIPKFRPGKNMKDI